MIFKVNNLRLETTLEQFVKDWKLDLNKVKQVLENGWEPTIVSFDLDDLNTYLYKHN